MLYLNSRVSIAIRLEDAGWDGLAREMYWYASLSLKDRKKRPELHAVMSAPKKKLPLFINHEEGYVRLIAKWRLKHNK